MTVREYVRKNSGVEREALIAGAMKALKVSRRTVIDVIANERKKGVHGAKPATKKSLADFRAQYDKSFIVPEKIRAAVKRLGRDGWAYEIDFARDAGVSISDISRYAEPFAGLVVELKERRRAWAGSEETANAMREML